jgi:hypothetical protein
VQRTLVEAWGLIRETFVDPTFNHQGIFGYFYSDLVNLTCGISFCFCLIE